MGPKLSKTKGDAKGKGKASTSFATMETPISLVSNRYAEEFEAKHKHRFMVKQYVWKASVVGSLDIPEVASIIAHHQIDYFLQLAQDYLGILLRVAC